MIPEVKCVACRFFDRNECRRYPDTISMNDFDWCGEFRRSSKWTAAHDAALDKRLNPPPEPVVYSPIDEITVSEIKEVLNETGVPFEKSMLKKELYGLMVR